MATLLLNQICWANPVCASSFQGYLPKENNYSENEGGNVNELGAKSVTQVVRQFGDALKERTGEQGMKLELAETGQSTDRLMCNSYTIGFL